MTRDEKIERLTFRLANGGWSSIYSFVEEHAEEYELDEMDDEDEDEDDNDSDEETDTIDDK